MTGPMIGPMALAVTRDRTAVMAELRRLMPRMEEQRKALPFGLAAIDSHLPDGGLTCGALHEVVPTAESCIAAAFGFLAAILARICSPPPPGPRLRAPECKLVGEGQGWGSRGDVQTSTIAMSPPDPHPTLPTRGREQSELTDGSLPHP
jgi:hypothetical protein